MCMVSDSLGFFSRTRDGLEGYSFLDGYVCLVCQLQNHEMRIHNYVKDLSGINSFWKLFFSGFIEPSLSLLRVSSCNFVIVPDPRHQV